LENIKSVEAGLSACPLRSSIRKMMHNTIENIFRKFNPKYQPRWEVYEMMLNKSITKDTTWLDIGCGKNELVANYGSMAKSAVGIDILDNEDRTNAPFLLSDLRNIPLPSDYADLITMRLVVEHLEKIPEDFSEICRLLIPGGKLIILTTNSLSPIVFLPRLLPYRLKSWIIQKMLDVDSREIFPTYHRFNTANKMAKGLPEMALSSIDYIEQVPLTKPFLLILFGLWYTIVKISIFKYYRSNLLAVFHKTSA
jgi:ubiquinone/menaquinone biosynthesis C-methylase UbiE